MMRLILFVVLIAALAMAFSAIVSALRVIEPQHTSGTGDTMPKTISKVAYVVLIILMFGIASGWLGGA